jgi:two-component system copper resistance phosphate regulon response regulator CusR
MTPAIPSSAGNRRVLIVDDEPFVVIVLERFLRESQFQVGCAQNGAEALRVFSESSWDLVITDRAMPEMNGEQLAEEIKRTAPGTPVILMTGLNRPGTITEHFDAILPKPFSQKDLLALVLRVLADREKPAACASAN